MIREERKAVVRSILTASEQSIVGLDAIIARIVDAWEHAVADERFTTMTRLVLPVKKSSSHIFIWRLTLACGHLKLWGPHVDGSRELLVGDHTACWVCPTRRENDHRVAQQHLVVNVEEVDQKDCSPVWILAATTD